MIDWAATGLTHLVTFEVLDNQRRSVNALDGVRSLKIERNWYSQPRTGGSLEFTPLQDFNLDLTLIRPWVTVQYQGEEEHYPLITARPEVTGEQRTADAGVGLSLKLFDLTTALDDVLGSTYTVAPGDVVTGRVREVIASVGVLDPAITESSATIASGMYWGPTETKRRVVNDLLDAIGYAAVWVDVWGQLQCHPYQDPGSRALHEDLALEHGKRCVYKPDLTIEHDTSKVPNHAVLVSRAEGEEEPLVADVYLPASHPYSRENRGGRVVPYTESDVELAAYPTVALRQAALEDLAVKRLLARSTPARTISLEHGWRPTELGQKLPFFIPASGRSPELRGHATISSESISYSAGKPLGTVAATIQEVPQ